MTPPQAEVLHPARLVARRREVRRARVKRIRRLVLGVLTTVTLAYGAWAIVHSSLFALDGIDVVGTRRVTRSEILSVSGVRLGMNVLSVDPGSVSRRVAALPYVASAHVERIYPSKIRIVIGERSPAAVVALPAGRWLVDAGGVALGPVGETDGFVVIHSASGDPVQPGSRIADAGVRQGLAVWRGLPSALRSSAFFIDATSPAAVSVRLGNATVVFGDATRLSAKIEALEALLARARSSRRALRSANLEAPERPAARFVS